MNETWADDSAIPAVGKNGSASRGASRTNGGGTIPVELAPELGAAPTVHAEPKFADLVALLEGPLEPERPSVAEWQKGRFLFYPGRLNEIHGEPAGSKTNSALAAAALVGAAGGTVVFIDPEDTALGILRRYRLLGGADAAVREGRFRYHSGPESESEWAALHLWAQREKPALVVLDGLAEMLAADGCNEDVPAEVLEWFRCRATPFAEAGAAVLITDHVVKNAENRGRWQRGTGAKLGRYDGAVYQAQVIARYRPGKAGGVKLVLSKDRNGGVESNEDIVCEIWFEPDGEKTRVVFREPQAPSACLTTQTMAKVMDHLAANPDSGTSELRTAAGGRAQIVDKAIRSLVKDGYLRKDPGGPGRKTKFQILKSYPES